MLQIISIAYNISQHVSDQQSNNVGEQIVVAEMTTVEFIVYGAEEFAKMVTKGELPTTVHGANVLIQNPNNDRVSIN